MRNPYEIAGEFLAEWFGAEDTFALLLRHADPSRTRQRIVRQGDLLKANYVGWLAHENARGANIYFSVNPLLSGAKKRTKNAIAEARALYLDLDEDGDRKMAAIRASDNVPPPSVVIRTSPGKYQILWRVRSFSIPEEEAMLKTLAAVFGGDRACTDCARVLRLPGFFNRKYTPACMVTLASDAIPNVYSPDDFKLEMPSVALADSGGVNVYSPMGSVTQSENDWAWVMAQLAAGTPASQIVQMLISSRCDKPNPPYYARRTVDVASAVLWARKGISFKAIARQLETHNQSLSKDGAAEIAATASRFVQRTQFTQQGEPICHC
jgi:hypothetical protein